MDLGAFRAWLDAYKAAWEERDPEAVKELFTPEGIYYWTPLGEPKRGRAQIAEAWRQATSRQGEIHLEYELLAVTGNRGIARWWCSFVRKGSQRKVRLDGIFLVTLNRDNLCELFQEWWHSDEDGG